MKLLSEHGRSVSPAVRNGVFLLLLHGEVVFIGVSDHIFRSVVEYQNEDRYSFDAFSWLTCGPEEAGWLAIELIEKYKPAHNSDEDPTRPVH